MKGLRELGEVLHRPLFVRITVLALTAIVSFYFGRHWSAGYPQLVFYTGAAAGERHSPFVAVSTNANLALDVSALLAPDAAEEPPLQDESPEALPSSPSPPPPPPLSPERVGIVDENGTMREDFDVGSFDPDLVDDDGGEGNEMGTGNVEVEGRARVKIKTFHLCPKSMSEYIPCLDNEEETKKLKSTERGEKFERHCPAEGKGLDCLVPAPKNYKTPIPWPRSRGEIKEGKTGFQEIKTNSNFQVVEPSLYMEPINTWIRFLRWSQIWHLVLIQELPWMLGVVWQVLVLLYCHAMSQACLLLQKMFMKIRFNLHLNVVCQQ